MLVQLRCVYALAGILWLAIGVGEVVEAQLALKEPRVARVQMRLTFSEDLVDVIEKGDLLTILEERGDNFLIQSYSGRKGLVAKANAVSLAESASIYSELIESTPEEGRLYTLRAGARWAAGDAEQAMSDFDKAISLGYEAPHAYMSRGLFFAARGEHEKAVADYTMAIDKEPTDVSPRINRAAANLILGKVDLALADYSAAIDGRPNDPLLYQQRAVALKSLGKFDEAIQDFTKAIELAGPTTKAAIAPLMSRGFLYFQQSIHEQAVADFSSVIELNPQATVAFNNRGYNRLQMGKIVEALQDFDKAIALEPKYGLAHQNRAWLLATTDASELRNPAAAIDSATTACELSDYKDVSDMAALAAACAANGDFELAVGWQEKVIAQASDLQKPFAQRILELYLDKKPFDAKLASELSATLRSAETANPEANKTEPKPNATPLRNKRAL